MERAEELHRRAVAALTRRRFGDAGRLLDRARAEARTSDTLARVAASRAFLEYELGDLDTAFALCTEALAMDGVGAETRGIVRCQFAMLLLRRGEPSAALDAFEAAIGDLTDPVELGKAHINRGGVHLARGETGLAGRDFELARTHWARAGRTDESAMATHNLGYARFLEGDLVGALRHMDASAPTLLAMSPVMAATVSQDRAEVLLAAGLVDEGRRALEAAAAAFGRRRMAQRRAEAEYALARTLLLDDPAAALVRARGAARRFERVGAGAWARRAEAQEIAALVELGRSRRGLVDRVEELSGVLEEQGLTWAGAAVRLHGVRILVRGGRLRDAARRLDRAVPVAEAPMAVRLLDHDVRAEVAAADGQPGRALQHLRAGLSDLHAWQSSFGSLDLQTGVTGHGVRLAARGLALAVGSDRPEVLFEWSERARMLASRVQPVRAPEDEQIVADLAELREMASDHGRRDAAREVVLRQRVRERAWQHRGSGEVADPVSLEKLRGSLGTAAALVAYVVAADRVVALVVTAAHVVRVDLGSRTRIDGLLGGLLPDLDVAASDLPGAMAGFVRQELADRLSAIAAVLVEPVLGAVGDRRVVLTPSGVLAGVPWTLLPGFTGRPLTVAQSATSWLARCTTPLRTDTAGFVAGPRVARAEDEVTAAAKEWSSAHVLTGPDATAAAVSALAASVDVLHVAAHGRHSSENAMFSGLQLADGPWFGYDIDRLRRVPDVVLLSACEVGRSTVRWGDELIGMATAWLHAGARCVVASPAAVNDRAAYDVLVAVHEQLAAGVDPAAALATAISPVSATTAPVPMLCFG